MPEFRYLCKMSIDVLQKYIPENSLVYVKKWFGDFSIRLKITRERQSKLGDYRKLGPNTFQITINTTHQPELFFFVLTHELAHLHAFHNFGPRIAPHGAEWKHTFREMILESLTCYSQEFQLILLKFAKAPKANYMASREVVRYFHIENEDESVTLLENLEKDHVFLHRKSRFQVKDTTKKNYICINLENGKSYRFSTLVEVKKL